MYPVEVKQLHLPSLDEVAKVLQDGLSKNFQQTKVEAVNCPDLTQSPYNLMAPGLNGSPRIADVGGVPYLTPTPHLDKNYDLDNIAQLMELPDAFVIGAGAGHHKFVGVNSEMVSNLVTGSSPKNGSHIIKCVPDKFGYSLEKLPIEERNCSLMQNLFACEGKPGKVLKISVKQRCGEENLITCMRKSLEKHFGENVVALGGTFRLVKGSAKCHVMPDFSKTPLSNDDEVSNWLKYFDMEAPMVFMSVLVSKDPGLDLRIEHSHGHGIKNGGHYHYDVTPETVEYEGYFNIAEKLYRIDRP